MKDATENPSNFLLVEELSARMETFIKIWLKYVSVYTQITKTLAQKPYQREEPVLLIVWCHSAHGV